MQCAAGSGYHRSMGGGVSPAYLARIAGLGCVLALLLLAYDARPASPPADAVTVRGVQRAGQPATPETVPASSSASVEPAESAPPAGAVEMSMLTPALDPAPWGSAPRRLDTAPPAPSTGALAVIVVDEASGAVLYERDAHRELAPASLTKIATAIVVLRRGELDADAISDVDGFTMRGSTTMGLYSGDRLSRRDLLYGLMLPSGNDAALVLGRNLAGSDEAFVAEMNAMVRGLGLRHTAFATPHGLGRAGYSSAYDMAMLARHAMQYPEFRQVVSTISWNVGGTRSYAVHNINSFLFNYDGADGVKTGYTNGAGHTLVASATRDGHRLYAVLLNDQTRYMDAAALLDWAFANHTWPDAP